MNTVTTIATAAVLLALNSFASAAQVQDLPTRVVRVTQLDGRNEQGARELYARLKLAADHVCSDQLSDRRQWVMDRAYDACVQFALGHAVMQINRPLLSAYAFQHGLPIAGAAGEIAANR